MKDTPFIPYGRQTVDEDDISAVVAALRSDWLTTGPAVETFEQDICAYTGAGHGVAVSNGTAALHAAMHALNISSGDEVIVPSMTFAASSNCILYQGGKPVFADVFPDTLLLDPSAVEAAITPNTKAIIGVDYAGQPCDWDSLRAIADRHNIFLVADACHSLGALYKGQKVGALADITVFSFHPVKPITTGEGGMAVTNDAALAQKMRAFRGHGITTTASQREKSGAWFYEMTDLGYNYRITDIQCALGSSQLKKLDTWRDKREAIALMYAEKLNGSKAKPLALAPNVRHAWHLYVVKIPERDKTFKMLRDAGIGANVHYTPVHLHPYYQQLGYKRGICPVAEESYGQIITLPLWPGMDERDVDRVVDTLLQK